MVGGVADQALPPARWSSWYHLTPEVTFDQRPSDIPSSDSTTECMVGGACRETGIVLLWSFGCKRYHVTISIIVHVNFHHIQAVHCTCTCTYMYMCMYMYNVETHTHTQVSMHARTYFLYTCVQTHTLTCTVYVHVHVYMHMTHMHTYWYMYIN